MKYREWILHWLNHYILPSVKDRTYTRYSEIAEKHILPAIGELELREITPFALQCFVTRLLESGNLSTGGGLSPSSVNCVITVMQSSLKTAYALGYMKESMAGKVKRPRTSERKVSCFSYDEQRRMEQYIRVCEKPRLLGILLSLYTGLRIGELLALEWSDIDLTKGELRVCKTCHAGRGRDGTPMRIVDLPKTPSSVRTIPLPRQLIPLLRRAKKKSASRFVVSNGEKPVPIRAYQRTFASFQKRLNIPRRGFHSLRHTFATRALECGMDVKTLSELLGHKNPTVTLNRYVHSPTEYKKAMMNRLGRMMF